MSEQEIWIVVGQAGWVHIGYLEERADEFVLRKAATIRRWGTSSGLGQLALQGPQSSTVLDPCGEYRVHKLCTVGRYRVVSAAWEAIL